MISENIGLQTLLAHYSQTKYPDDIIIVATPQDLTDINWDILKVFKVSREELSQQMHPLKMGLYPMIGMFPQRGTQMWKETYGSNEDDGTEVEESERYARSTLDQYSFSMYLNGEEMMVQEVKQASDGVYEIIIIPHSEWEKKQGANKEQ